MLRRPKRAPARTGGPMERRPAKGEPGSETPVRPLAAEKAAARRRRDADVRLKRALSRYASLVMRGEDPETAHVATIRALLVEKRTVEARAYCLGIESTAEGRRPAILGAGLCLQVMGRQVAVWEHLRDLEPEFLARHAPIVAVGAALLDGTPEASAGARAIAADPGLLATPALPELAGRFLVVGLVDLARELYDAARARPDIADQTRHQLENLGRWLGAASTDGGEVPEVPAGRIRFGLFDYRHPDLVRAAGNVGDHVQTLALLGNLLRFRDVTFHGADGLGEVATGLQQRVRPDLWLDGPTAEVELLPVSRDYSEGDRLPEDTWIAAFGGHMQGLYRLRFGFPYHRNVNPIFVAFHLNRTEALTPEAIDYLREHGPIGCRDHTTVDLLLSAEVDAFFTGCLTSTVDAVLPPREEVAEPDQVVAAIDVPVGTVRAKRPVEEISHAVDARHDVSLAQGLRNAEELLTTYLRRFHRIVTSRLHSYLPATSLGVPVRFRPDVPGEARFAGLLGMTPAGEEFVAMRDGMRMLLADIFGLVLSGASRDEVYTHWRELTADRVTRARERFAAPPASSGPGFDCEAAVAQVRAATNRVGPHDLASEAVTDVVLSIDANYREMLPVTLESLVANASGPLHVHVTGRGLDADYRAWLSAAFPAVPFTFLDFDAVEYGRVARMLGHVSTATMDRLLLPDVLAELDRITYIDIDTVTLGDVCELARIDLGGHPLAARPEHFSATKTWRAVGDLLDPADAEELRRVMGARHGHDFTTFNAGVMVLDLARMRADGFVPRVVPMALRFGLHDQDALNAYAGRDRLELDRVWNCMPVRESVDGARVIHFAGAGKPWEELLVAGGSRWREYAERFRSRAGTWPPAG